MGLFSSKYVHHVGTAIQRVIDPKNIVDPLNLAITESVYRKVDLVDNILEYSLQSLPVKASSLYSYVASRYPAKLPSGKALVDTRFYDAAEPILNSWYPEGNIQYVRFGPMNAFHEAWHLLHKDFDYDPIKQRIGIASNPDADFIVEYLMLELPLSLKEVFTTWEIDSWTATNNQPTSVFASLEQQIIPRLETRGILYSNTTTPRGLAYGKLIPKKKPSTPPDVPDVPQYIPVEIPLEKFRDGHQYYQMLTETNNGDGDIISHFDLYKYQSGTQPTLDAVLLNENHTTIGLHFPNIYYRLDKAPANDAAYNVFSRRLGMDYTKIKDSINQNPDIGDVETAAFTLGVPANTTNSLEASYIYDYFDKVHSRNASSVIGLAEYQKDWTTNYKTPTLSDPKSAILINDDKMKTALTYERIARTFHKGKLFPVGGASVSVENETRYYDTVDIDGNKSFGQKTVKFYVFRKQVSQDIYRELRVYDLSMVYTIGGEYLNTVGDDTGNQEICLIPLDKSILEKYDFSKKNELLNRSFHFVFNSHVIQKVKWYQQGWFADLLTVIAVVIFVYTGIDFLSGLAAALELSTAAALHYVAINLLNAVLYSLAFKIFVKIVGNELAFLAALVAAAFGMMKGSIGPMSPTDLLNLASGIFKGINDYLATQFKDLQEEIESWTSLKTIQDKDLDAANDLLEVKSNPAAAIINGELPSQFLYRNLVFSVSEFTSINDVSTFVEQALHLPVGD